MLEGSSACLRTTEAAVTDAVVHDQAAVYLPALSLGQAVVVVVVSCPSIQELGNLAGALCEDTGYAGRSLRHALAKGP